MDSPSFKKVPAVGGGAASRLSLLQQGERREGLLTPRHRGLRLALDVLEREEPESEVRVAVLPSRQLVLEPSELSEALRLVHKELPDPDLRWIQELPIREEELQEELVSRRRGARGLAQPPIERFPPLGRDRISLPATAAFRVRRPAPRPAAGLELVKRGIDLTVALAPEIFRVGRQLLPDLVPRHRRHAEEPQDRVGRGSVSRHGSGVYIL